MAADSSPGPARVGRVPLRGLSLGLAGLVLVSGLTVSGTAAAAAASTGVRTGVSAIAPAPAKKPVRGAFVGARLSTSDCRVRVRVDWHDRWRKLPGRHVSHVRVITQRGDARRVVWQANGRGDRPDVSSHGARLSGADCRRVKRADQVVAAVSQKHDGRDRGRSFERVVAAAVAETATAPGTRHCRGAVVRRNADLRKCRLGGVSLRGADLSGADLRGADLTGADLRGVNLAGADLREALLGWADLGRANLRGTDLAAADLEGARLHRVRNARAAEPYGIVAAARSDGRAVRAFGLEPPGPLEIIDAGEQIYETVERCEANKEAGLPCMQSTAKTVTEVYSMLKEFTEQYAVDQQRNQDALTQISYDVKNGTYDQEILALTSDFEQAQVGLSLYQAMTACMVAWWNEQPTCPNIDAQGNPEGDQPANLTSILRERDAFVASQNPANYEVSLANDMLNRVGGLQVNATNNPYNTSYIGVLSKLVDRDRTAEKQNIGLGVPDRLQVLGPDYVNRVGADVTSIINAEAVYFIARGLEQKFVTRPGETGNEWQNAAANGGSNGTMSIDEQRAAFTFPGWSPTNQMLPNQAYVQRADKSWALITTESYSTGMPATYPDLITPEEMADVTTVVGPLLGLGEIQSLYPELLPPVTGTLAPGNAARQAARDDAVMRWWTTPQDTTQGMAFNGWLEPGTPVDLYGSHLRAKVVGEFRSHWKTRQSADDYVEQTSLPYSVFKVKTDTVHGADDIFTDIAGTGYAQYCGHVWSCDGGLPDTRWVMVHADSSYFRGITGYQAPTWASLPGSQGMYVRYQDITAATVTMDAVPTSGLLTGAA